MAIEHDFIGSLIMKDLERNDIFLDLTSMTAPSHRVASEKIASDQEMATRVSSWPVTHH